MHVASSAMASENVCDSCVPCCCSQHPCIKQNLITRDAKTTCMQSSQNITDHVAQMKKVQARIREFCKDENGRKGIPEGRLAALELGSY